MSTTAAAPVVLVLPRATRAALAKLADRIARKGHGMSGHAAAAVAALLADSDRVELEHLPATALMAATYAECARAELARSRGKMTARQQQFADVIYPQVQAQFQNSGWEAQA